MKDKEIIALYVKRSEKAIHETVKKYHFYCGSIAGRILNNQEDCEECLNDTWLKAWESIPPVMPTLLSAYLGKIARNLAINMYKRKYAHKRVSERLTVPIDELKECLRSDGCVEEAIEEKFVVEKLNEYLRTLPDLERKIFVRRYFYMDTLKEIAELFQMKESYTKTLLYRTRMKLKKYFEQEGIVL